MVCFGELGWRAGDELFVVGWELGLGGAGAMLFVVEMRERACILNMVVVKLR